MESRDSVGGVDCTAVTEMVFKPRSAAEGDGSASGDETEQPGLQLTEYGVVTPHDSGGVLIEGVTLDELPPVLQAKLQRRLAGLRTGAPSSAVAKVIRQAVWQDLVGDICCVVKERPLVFSSEVFHHLDWF